MNIITLGLPGLPILTSLFYGQLISKINLSETLISSCYVITLTEIRTWMSLQDPLYCNHTHFKSYLMGIFKLGLRNIVHIQF